MVKASLLALPLAVILAEDNDSQQTSMAVTLHSSWAIIGSNLVFLPAAWYQIVQSNVGDYDLLRST